MRKCPNCHSFLIYTERRLDGDSECGDCGHKAPTSTFDKKDEVSEAIQLLIDKGVSVNDYSDALKVLKNR